MYSWDIGFTAHLSKKKPRKDKDFGYSFSDCQQINPEILRLCGVSIRYDIMGEEGEDFYYGKQSDGHGSHNPAKIILNLPKPLLESWGL
jgi:hypothetical protein